MLLSKEIAVYLNLVACKFKQFTSASLKRVGIDLTPEQFLLIDLLWNIGPMSQQKVADTMHKDKNSVTKLIDGLEKKGLVLRGQDKKDRRLNIISLTPQADEMKSEAKEKGISILDTILEGISERELRAFLGTIRKLDANMDLGGRPSADR